VTDAKVTARRRRRWPWSITTSDTATLAAQSRSESIEHMRVHGVEQPRIRPLEYFQRARQLVRASFRDRAPSGAVRCPAAPSAAGTAITSTHGSFGALAHGIRHLGRELFCQPNADPIKKAKTCARGRRAMPKRRNGKTSSLPSIGEICNPPAATGICAGILPATRSAALSMEGQHDGRQPVDRRRRPAPA